MVPSPPENDKFSIIQNYELFYIQQNISTTFCYINHCAHSCPWLRCGRSGGTPIYIYVQISGGGIRAECHLLRASCAKNLLLPSSHSHPFNPTIADVLYLSTYLESWGSGAKRIMDECKGQNIKEPDWYQEGHNVVIKFARESMMSGEQPISNRHDTDMIPTSNQQQKTVLSVLLTGEKHIQELMDVCGYKDRDSFRKSVLNVMIEKEWVAMTLPDKPRVRLKDIS